jgi:MFS family permease
MILTTMLTVVSVLGVWLPAGNSKAGLVVFALIFGFASGSNISLTPVCIGQLCQTGNYGRYYATCYTIVSIGCLTGIPIVGEIIAVNHGDYWGLILFVGVCYVGGLSAFVTVRLLRGGLKLKVAY